MSDAVRSPRQIAEEKNESSNFAPTETTYDPVAGTPTAQAGTRPPRDYAANPTNPPEPAAPVRNLKR